MTILRRFEPPLQWNVVVLDKGIGDKYVTLPWYKFLQEGDLLYGELSLLGDDGAIFSSSILSISLVPWLIIFPYSIDMNKLIEIKLRRVFNFISML